MPLSTYMESPNVYWTEVCDSVSAGLCGMLSMDWLHIYYHTRHSLYALVSWQGVYSDTQTILPADAKTGTSWPQLLRSSSNEVVTSTSQYDWLVWATTTYWLYIYMCTRSLWFGFVSGENTSSCKDYWHGTVFVVAVLWIVFVVPTQEGDQQKPWTPIASKKAFKTIHVWYLHPQGNMPLGHMALPEKYHPFLGITTIPTYCLHDTCHMMFGSTLWSAFLRYRLPIQISWSLLCLI